MTSILRQGIAIGLFAAAFAPTIGAAACFFMAERSPRSEVARRLIEHEQEYADINYSPDTELLDARGQHLRRVGRRLSWIAFVAMLGLMSFSLAVH